MNSEQVEFEIIAITDSRMIWISGSTVPDEGHYVEVVSPTGDVRGETRVHGTISADTAEDSAVLLWWPVAGTCLGDKLRFWRPVTPLERRRLHLLPIFFWNVLGEKSFCVSYTASVSSHESQVSFPDSSS